MSPGSELAIAAESLVGTPFRLYGRNPATGLDCVGLVSASLTMIGRQPLSLIGYSLRNRDVKQWVGEARRAGFRPVNGEIEIGDVVLVSPSPLQHHLMISGKQNQVIHAHASLRRVVREPMTSNTLAAHWRLLQR